MAILFLKGHDRAGRRSNTRTGADPRDARQPGCFTANTGDGPTAANIPGVVAGLDMLYRKYGSKKVAWADLIAPAIEYAEKGYVLDEALPTSIAEGRKFFAEVSRRPRRSICPAARRRGRRRGSSTRTTPTTLRAIARDGAETFYRGAIARRIADDMARHGGLITLDDLAQYRAIERRPLVGRYRDHTVYSAPPPVSYRRAARRDAADPGELPAAGRRDLRDGRGLPALRDRGLEGARPGTAHRGSGALRGQPGPAPRCRRTRSNGSSGSIRRRPRSDRNVPEEGGQARTDRPRDDGVRGRGRRRQHDRDHADAEHVGRQLLRIGGARLSLQQSPARRRRTRPGRFLPLTRSSSTSVPTLLFRRHRAPRRPACPGSPSRRPATRGFPRRSTTSS